MTGVKHFLDVLVGDVSLFGEMLPKVLAGCLIGAFVTLLLPRELVARWVGHESGFTGLLIAAFFGFLLPGGPITIYPVAGAFLVMGADAGAVVAFIVSWTLIGYTRALVWELPFFGADFVIWRMVAATPLPIIAGLLARIAVRAGFQISRRNQMTLAINILLWLVVGVLAVIAATRGRVLLEDGARAGVMEFILLLPRIGIGVVGSGFVAEALPNEWIAPWLGPESGLLGVLIATFGGALTPGGPVVGFSIGAAALKSGAGAPQVIAYSTAWALYAIHRLVIWEVPMMPARVVWLRALVSLPLPFLAAGLAILLGRP